MNDVPLLRRGASGVAAVLAALVVAATACGDDPFSFDWEDTPDTVQLYSLARPELNLNSAFAFYTGVAYRVEDPDVSGQWDAAVDTQGGEIVLLPPGALGIAARGAIAPLPGFQLDEVEEAPADTTLYSTDQPVPVQTGTIYVIRTNRRQGSFGATCVYYAKMEPLVIDAAGGRLTFRFVTSPVCNSRELVPPN